MAEKDSYHGTTERVEAAPCDPQGAGRNTDPEGSSGTRIFDRTSDPTHRETDTARRRRRRYATSTGQAVEQKTAPQAEGADRPVSTKTTYADFGPTLFTEKLEEREGISVSRETATRLAQGREAYGRRTGDGRPTVNGGRERIAMERCSRWTVPITTGLKAEALPVSSWATIDDATGSVYGRFYGYEGTIPAMDSFKRYIKKVRPPHERLSG